MDEKGNKDKQTPPVESKEPIDARDTGDKDANQNEEKSGGRPPPDDRKRERGTGTPSNSGRGESSSTSEYFSSSEDTTPPTVVLVVPRTGRRYNKTREAPIPKAGTTYGAKLTTRVDQTPPERKADEREEEQRVDGDIIYTKEDKEAVESGMTCSDMGGTHNEPLRADHLSPGAPPLAQPSQTNDSNTGLTNTFEEPQKTYIINGKKYGINGKLSANDGWEFQKG